MAQVMVRQMAQRAHAKSVRAMVEQRQITADAVARACIAHIEITETALIKMAMLFRNLMAGAPSPSPATEVVQ